MFRFIALAVLVLATSVSASAQTFQDDAVSRPSPTVVDEPADELTLAAALNLAFAGSPELSPARREVLATQAAIGQAGVLPNPTVALDAIDTRRDTRETTLQVTQPIEFGNKRARRVEAAERTRQVANAELLARQAELKAAVIAGFFNVLNAQERVRLAQTSFDLARQSTTVTGRRVIAGKVSPVEETRGRVAEAGARLELIQAGTELKTAKRSLSALWGNPHPRFRVAVGDLDWLPALDQEALNRIERGPLLSKLRAEVERRNALLGLERSRRLPDVGLTLGMRRNEALGRNQAVVGVSVPIPLFDRNAGNIREAAVRADKARDELELARTRLRAQLLSALDRLESNRAELAAIKDTVLPGAQSAYDAAIKGYEFGKFSFLDVLDAQRTLLQSRTQYLRTLSEAHRSAAEIEGLAGTPLSTEK